MWDFGNFRDFQLESFTAIIQCCASSFSCKEKQMSVVSRFHRCLKTPLGPWAGHLQEEHFLWPQIGYKPQALSLELSKATTSPTGQLCPGSMFPKDWKHDRALAGADSSHGHVTKISPKLDIFYFPFQLDKLWVDEYKQRRSSLCNLWANIIDCEQPVRITNWIFLYFRVFSALWKDINKI